MKNFFQKQREIVALFCYVLFVMAVVYGVIFPLISKINSVKDQIEQDAMQQQSDRQHLSELPKIRDQYETLEKNSSAVDLLLDKNNEVEVIESLEKLADSSGDKITISVKNIDTATSAVPVAKKAQATDDNALVDALPSKFRILLRHYND